MTSTPPYDKGELKQGLPLAGTPTPPSSNPDAKPSNKRTLLFDDDVADLRPGHVTRVNHTDVLAEMRAAALPQSPSPLVASPKTPSVVRGSSTYFAGGNAPAPGGKKRLLVINTNQEQNRQLLKHLSHVQVEWASNIGPDFIFTQSACGFFLSMKYYRYNNGYLKGRVHEVRNYSLRVVICLVDVEDSAKPITALSHECLLLNVTLILAWSHKEAARYIETYKAYEGRPATMLQERVEENEKHADVLQVVRFINKTDVQTLAQTFGTLKRIARAPMEELSLCPGLGARKVQKLHAAFNDPIDPAVARKKQAAAAIAPYLTTRPIPAAAGTALSLPPPPQLLPSSDLIDLEASSEL